MIYSAWEPEKISSSFRAFLFSMWYNRDREVSWMSASPEQRMRRLQCEITRLEADIARNKANLARAEMAAMRDRQRERKRRNHRLFVIGAELLSMFPELIEGDDDQAREFVHGLVHESGKSESR